MFFSDFLGTNLQDGLKQIGLIIQSVFLLKKLLLELELRIFQDKDFLLVLLKCKLNS